MSRQFRAVLSMYQHRWFSAPLAIITLVFIPFSVQSKTAMSILGSSGLSWYVMLCGILIGIRLNEQFASTSFETLPRFRLIHIRVAALISFLCVFVVPFFVHAVRGKFRAYVPFESMYFFVFSFTVATSYLVPYLGILFSWFLLIGLMYLGKIKFIHYMAQGYFAIFSGVGLALGILFLTLLFMRLKKNNNESWEFKWKSKIDSKDQSWWTSLKGKSIFRKFFDFILGRNVEFSPNPIKHNVWSLSQHLRKTFPGMGPYWTTLQIAGIMFIILSLDQFFGWDLWLRDKNVWSTNWLFPIIFGSSYFRKPRISYGYEMFRTSTRSMYVRSLFVGYIALVTELFAGIFMGRFFTDLIFQDKMISPSVSGIYVWLLNMSFVGALSLSFLWFKNKVLLVFLFMIVAAGGQYFVQFFENGSFAYGGLILINIFVTLLAYQVWCNADLE